MPLVNKCSHKGLMFTVQGSFGYLKKEMKFLSINISIENFGKHSMKGIQKNQLNKSYKYRLPL